MHIQLINAATLPYYTQQLAQLLCDAVIHGASVGFDDQITPKEANHFFQQLAPAISRGEQWLWIAQEIEQQEEKVVGTVQLQLSQKANGQNRAEVQKLLTHSSARRRGIGQQLMKTLEHAALQQQRGLLYLDTLAGSPAEFFYQTLGYQRVGELPDFATTPDGRYCPTAIYYKRLFIR